MKKPTLVEVYWKDIYAIRSDEDFDESKPLDDRLAYRRTVGWLHMETEDELLLVQEYEKSGKPSDYVTFPKSVIIDMVQYRKAKTGIKP